MDLEIENGHATVARSEHMGFYGIPSGVLQAYESITDLIDSPSEDEDILSTDKERQLQSFRAFVLSYFRKNFVEEPRLTDQHVMGIFSSMRNQFKIKVPTGTPKEFADIFNYTLLNKVKATIEDTRGLNQQQLTELNEELRDQERTPGVLGVFERVFQSLSAEKPEAQAVLSESEAPLVDVKKKQSDKESNWLWWIGGLSVIGTAIGGCVWWRGRK